MYITTLRETIVVGRPLAECFRYLRDFSTIEQWDPGVYRARKITPGAVAVGSEFDLILATPAGRVPMHYRLTELSENRALRLSGSAKDIEADDRITLTSQGKNSTRIDYEAELRLAALPAFAGALAQPLLRRLGRRAVDGLRAALDAPEQTKKIRVKKNWAQRLVLPAAVSFTERGYLAMPVKSHSRYLDGQTVVITGPTGGIGLAAACELGRLGARLVLIGRGQTRLQDAAQQIRDFAGRPCEIRLIAADLGERDELQHAADVLLKAEPRIDVLVNNAGVLLASEERTTDGIERSLAVNLLAPFRLTQRLLPRLVAAKGRVINVSSGGQYLQALDLDHLFDSPKKFDGVKAYARAKRGLISITQSWARQHRGVSFHAMHPGWAATPGVATSLPRFDQLMKRYLRDARMGADTVVWLASAPAERIGSGHFWLDRQPQPVDVVPGTAVSARDAQRLLKLLAALA